jgi:hypothetical protein
MTMGVSDESEDFGGRRVHGHAAGDLPFAGFDGAHRCLWHCIPLMPEAGNGGTALRVYRPSARHRKFDAYPRRGREHVLLLLRRIQERERRDCIITRYWACWARGPGVASAFQPSCSSLVQVPEP